MASGLMPYGACVLVHPLLCLRASGKGLATSTHKQWLVGPLLNPPYRFTLRIAVLPATGDESRPLEASVRSF